MEEANIAVMRNVKSLLRARLEAEENQDKLLS
jgi:hypothetical protein